MTRKIAFFEGWSWFKFNNLGVALGTNLKFYTSLSKGLKPKVRKFWGLIPASVEVTREKLVACRGEGLFAPPPPPPTSWTGLISFYWLTYTNKSNRMSIEWAILKHRNNASESRNNTPLVCFTFVSIKMYVINFYKWNVPLH